VGCAGVDGFRAGGQAREGEVSPADQHDRPRCAAGDDGGRGPVVRSEHLKGGGAGQHLEHARRA